MATTTADRLELGRELWECFTVGLPADGNVRVPVELAQRILYYLEHGYCDQDRDKARGLL